MSKRIPFNIKYRPQIESGEYKVETRDGKHVRILCYDANNIVPIVALVTFNDGSEGSRDYYHDGTMNYGGKENPLDLFIVTQEEELTPFENELATVIGFAIAQSVSSPNEKMVEFVKNWSERLLSLAREQLIKDGYVIEKKAFHDAVKKVDPKVMKEVSEKWGAMKEALRIEYERGKADALNDIPRWKRFAPIINDALSEQRICQELENSVLRVDVGGYCWVISREELNKLPKEDEE